VAGRLAVAGSKRGEPQGRGALQHTRAASEEQAVEVVENHEDGTWRSLGRLFPKADPRGRAGSGLRWCQDDGGAIFGQPQERQSSRATGWADGSAGVGKAGIEGQEGRVYLCIAREQTARTRVLEDEHLRASAEVNVRRAGGKPIAIDSCGQVPPSRRGSPARVAAAVMVRGTPGSARDRVASLKTR